MDFLKKSPFIFALPLDKPSDRLYTILVSNKKIRTGGQPDTLTHFQTRCNRT